MTIPTILRSGNEPTATIGHQYIDVQAHAKTQVSGRVISICRDGRTNQWSLTILHNADEPTVPATLTEATFPPELAPVVNPTFGHEVLATVADLGHGYCLIDIERQFPTTLQMLSGICNTVDANSLVSIEQGSNHQVDGIGENGDQNNFRPVSLTVNQGAGYIKRTGSRSHHFPEPLGNALDQPMELHPQIGSLAASHFLRSDRYFLNDENAEA